ASGGLFQQLLQGLHPGHAVADHDEFLLAHGALLPQAASPPTTGGPGTAARAKAATAPTTTVTGEASPAEATDAGSWGTRALTWRCAASVPEAIAAAGVSGARPAAISRATMLSRRPRPM